MSESSIAVGTTGKNLRTFEQVTSEGSVHTEALSIVDPENINQIARVTDSKPADDSAGVVVRVAGDNYSLGEILEDQTGAGAALTFTFSAAVQTVWVYAVDPADLTASGEVRIDPFGGTPTASLGIPVPLGVGFPIDIVASSVKVFAAADIRVTVYGNRR